MQNEVSHGRRIKVVLFVLAAMLLVSQLSSILLLNGVPAARIQGDDLELVGSERGVSLAESERWLRSVHRLSARS